MSHVSQDQLICIHLLQDSRDFRGCLMNVDLCETAAGGGMLKRCRAEQSSEHLTRLLPGCWWTPGVSLVCWGVCVECVSCMHGGPVMSIHAHLQRPCVAQVVLSFPRAHRLCPVHSVCKLQRVCPVRDSSRQADGVTGVVQSDRCWNSSRVRGTCLAAACTTAHGEADTARLPCKPSCTTHACC